MKDRMNLWELENELTQQYHVPVCGVDEAGRGPLAGPVYAAAVILPQNINIAGLDDSKALTGKKRDQLYDEITACALSWAIGVADVDEINRLNILEATFLAMNRAIAGLKPPAGFALIDGNQSRGIELPCKTVVGGDGLCASIAAASILAKVSRDRHMLELARSYPEYGFERHKGYATKAHYAALREHGPCPEHRQLFIRKLH